MGGSLFGSKNKTKFSNESLPWAEAIPYLAGDEDKNISGFFQDLYDNYQSGGFNPLMQGAAGEYRDLLNQRFTSPMFSNITRPGDQAINGMFDTNISPVSNITSPSVNISDARMSMGALDPTTPLQKLLSGRPDNPYLDSMAGGITRRMTRNLQQNVLPGIRGEAIMNGAMGGSRQGIAEGNAIGLMNEDLGNTLSNLYGGAYETAQNRMMGTALPLNDQAVNVASDNANRNFTGQQFNANLGLQNNQQAMMNDANNFSRRAAGLDMLRGGMNMQDTLYDQFQNLNTQPQNANFGNLQQYAGLLFPGAQLGGTSRGSGTQTSTPGIVPSILGAAAGIGGIASGLGMLGGGMSSLSGAASSGMNSFMPWMSPSMNFMRG